MGNKRKLNRPKRHNNQYNDEQKRGVIDAYVQSNKGIYKLSEEFGIPRQTIYLWLTRADFKRFAKRSSKPFTYLMSVSKNGKIIDLKECSSTSEAFVYKKIMENKGCEVEVREIPK